MWVFLDMGSLGFGVVVDVVDDDDDGYFHGVGFWPASWILDGWGSTAASCFFFCFVLHVWFGLLWSALV